MSNSEINQRQFRFDSSLTFACVSLHEKMDLHILALDFWTLPTLQAYTLTLMMKSIVLRDRRQKAQSSPLSSCFLIMQRQCRACISSMNTASLYPRLRSAGTRLGCTSSLCRTKSATSLLGLTQGHRSRDV